MDRLIAEAREHYDELMAQHDGDHDKAVYHVTHRFGHHVADYLFLAEEAR